MLEIIFKGNRRKYYKELSEMHRLRHHLFVEKLGWNLKTVNGMEFDQYDTDDSFYLIHKNSLGEVDACTRIIQTTQPNMLSEIFPYLISNNKPPKSPYVWETTRFGADTKTAPRNITGILIAGMLEFGIFMGAKNYVSVTNVPLEPLLKRAGWNPQRLGEPQIVGDDSDVLAAAEIYDVSHEMLNNVKRKSRILGKVISNLDDLAINAYREVA